MADLLGEVGEKLVFGVEPKEMEQPVILVRKIVI